MKLNRNTEVESLQVAPPDAKHLLGDVSSCKHIYNYYWKRGKCKGSKCILCGNLDRNLKPNVR